MSDHEALQLIVVQLFFIVGCLGAIVGFLLRQWLDARRKSCVIRRVDAYIEQVANELGCVRED